MKKLFIYCFSMFLLLIFTVNLSTQQAYGQVKTDEDRSWNQPVKPYRIIGNIYYVGASDVTSFLITSDSGHILIDGGFAETAPQIKDNIIKLGFKLKDVKILLNTQAHYDHAGGLALLKKWTNAKLMVMKGDVTQLTTGSRKDSDFGADGYFQPVKVDRILKDVDVVEIGGVKLNAYLTPGHTRGCTTFTLKATEEGKTYDVVFVGGLSVPGYTLINNKNYPNIVEDYTKTYKILKSLHCDVFLSSHGQFFSLKEKTAMLEKSRTPNLFIDENNYKVFLERMENAFNDQLQKERQALQKGN